MRTTATICYKVAQSRAIKTVVASKVFRNPSHLRQRQLVLPTSTMSITTPLSTDILCGKDKTYNKHPGNQVYRQLVADLSAKYASAATKQEKMRITRLIVTTMRTKHRSRFIRQVRTTSNAAAASSTKRWVEISDEQARDKTSHALRFCNQLKATRDSGGAGDAGTRPPFEGSASLAYAASESRDRMDGAFPPLTSSYHHPQHMPPHYPYHYPMPPATQEHQPTVGSSETGEHASSLYQRQQQHIFTSMRSSPPISHPEDFNCHPSAGLEDEEDGKIHQEERNISEVKESLLLDIMRSLSMVEDLLDDDDDDEKEGHGDATVSNKGDDDNVAETFDTLRSSDLREIYAQHEREWNDYDGDDDDSNDFAALL